MLAFLIKPIFLLSMYVCMSYCISIYRAYAISDSKRARRPACSYLASTYNELCDNLYLVLDTDFLFTILSLSLYEGIHSSVIAIDYCHNCKLSTVWFLVHTLLIMNDIQFVSVYCPLSAWLPLTFSGCNIHMAILVRWL